jgi:hypothetical protein
MVLRLCLCGCSSSLAVVACFPPTTLAEAPWGENYKTPQNYSFIHQKKSLICSQRLFLILLGIHNSFPQRATASVVGEKHLTTAHHFFAQMEDQQRQKGEFIGFLFIFIEILVLGR